MLTLQLGKTEAPLVTLTPLFVPSQQIQRPQATTSIFRPSLNIMGYCWLNLTSALLCGQLNNLGNCNPDRISLLAQPVDREYHLIEASSAPLIVEEGNSGFCPEMGFVFLFRQSSGPLRNLRLSWKVTYRVYLCTISSDSLLPRSLMVMVSTPALRNRQAKVLLNGALSDPSEGLLVIGNGDRIRPLCG